MSVSVAELMPRVEKGAAWLDANRPGWIERIDIDALDIQCCPRCVFGQVFGGFRTGARLLRYGDLDCVDHGVDLRNGEVAMSPNGWDLLRECWITAILERRFKAQHEETTSPALVAVEA